MDVLSVLERKVVELSADKLAVGAIDYEANMFDFGYIDSLTSVELLAFIEDEYGVEIPEVDLIGPVGSLRVLAEYIGRESGR